jgi:hypothetical protein
MDRIGLEIEVKRRQSELGADVYRKLPLGAAAPVYRLQSGESDTGLQSVFMCVFYYCRTYYKTVRVGGGGEWRTCAMRDDEPRPVWMSLPITH